MNESRLKQLWKEANEKWEESMILHKQNAQDIAKIKLHHFLQSMKPVKLLTLAVGILWVISGVIILRDIYTDAGSNVFLLVSMLLQVLLTAIALVFYILQLVRIYQADVSAPVFYLQKKVLQLMTSSLWATKILVFLLPIWTMFWWHNGMFASWTLLQLAIPLTVTAAATYISIWLFLNIKLENAHKKWFQLIFRGKEWTPLAESMKLLEEYND